MVDNAGEVTVEVDDDAAGTVFDVADAPVDETDVGVEALVEGTEE